METAHVVLAGAGVTVAILAGVIGFAVATARDGSDMRARIKSLELWRQEVEARVSRQLDELKTILEATRLKVEDISERLARSEARQEVDR